MSEETSPRRHVPCRPGLSLQLSLSGAENWPKMPKTASKVPMQVEGAGLFLRIVKARLGDAVSQLPPKLSRGCRARAIRSQGWGAN